MEILRVELDDLKEDLELLINESEKERRNGRLTDHVFFANLFLMFFPFSKIILGVDAFFKIIDGTDPDVFENLDDLLAHLRSAFREKVRVYGLAQAVNVCVERKLKKVAHYVTQKPDMTL